MTKEDVDAMNEAPRWNQIVLMKDVVLAVSAPTLITPELSINVSLQIW